MFSSWGQIKYQSILGMNTTLFVVFCVLLYELIKRNNDIAKIILIATFALFVKQMFNNRVGMNYGIATLPGFIKMVLILIGACVVLVPELYSHNLFRWLLFLNLSIMIVLCVVDAKYQDDKWKPYLKLQIVPLIGLLYILKNFPTSVKLKNGLITHVSDMKHWLVLQSVILSILYTQSDIFAHAQFISLVTVILPVLYSLKEYYNVRAVTLLLMLFSYLLRSQFFI